VQLSLDLAEPKRKRAKRRGPKVGARPRTRHRARPEHEARHPSHITLRAGRRVGSLRAERVLRLVRSIVARPKHDGFQVVHFSIQSDHVHLIVEADDKEALAWGVRSLVIRLAKRLNQMRGSSGAVWADRYHRRDLGTPTEVRRALVYVFTNAKKHLGVASKAEVVDLCSTAPSFDGWSRPLGAAITSRAPPHLAPKTWLLRIGWKRGGGPIRLDEAPRG
jgi:putative transposase